MTAALRIRLLYVSIAIAIIAIFIGIYVRRSKIQSIPYTESSQPSILYNQFCKRLGSCEQASVKIKASDTDDLYTVSVLGLQNNQCTIKLALEKTEQQKMKKFEGLNTTCIQDWKTEFKKIASLSGENCRDYTNTLLLNIALDLEKSGGVCTGSLKNKVRGI